MKTTMRERVDKYRSKHRVFTFVLPKDSPLIPVLEAIPDRNKWIQQCLKNYAAKHPEIFYDDLI